LREGDALLRVAAEVPGAARRLRRSFEEVRPGQSVLVRAKRGDLDLEMRVRRPHAGYLGVRIGEVDEQWRINNNLEAKSGVLVRQVLDDGPAKAAGLQAGDILVTVDGIPVGPMNLRALLTRIGADAEVELSLFREGEPRTLRLTLGRRP
jgi:C-terminal processing protease CtpA/Prc